MVSNSDGTDDITELMHTSIDQAVDFLKKLDVKIKKLNDDKDNSLAIFDR
jgi:hypothetical protein